MPQEAQALTIQPGIAVMMTSSIVGGPSYKKLNIDLTDEELQEITGVEEMPEGEVRKWETTRIIEDVPGYKAALTVRNRARDGVRGVCVRTQFGEICPLGREDDLNRKIADGQLDVQTFNSNNDHLKINWHCLKAYIRGSDTQALEAIHSTINEALAEMHDAYETGNYKKLRSVSKMLNQHKKILESGTLATSHLDEAIKNARAAARKFLARCEKGTETIRQIQWAVSSSPMRAAINFYTNAEVKGGVSQETQIPPASSALLAIQRGRINTL